MKKIDKIAIDVGHARGTGAFGNGLQEHEVCEQIALYLRNELHAHGLCVGVYDFPGMSNTGDLVATAQAVNAGGFGLCVSPIEGGDGNREYLAGFDEKGGFDRAQIPKIVFGA